MANFNRSNKTVYAASGRLTGVELDAFNQVVAEGPGWVELHQCEKVEGRR